MVMGKSNKLMHIKQGILEDQYGNKVAFNGSANETYSAYSRNIEQIAFFKNWEIAIEQKKNDFGRIYCSDTVENKAIESLLHKISFGDIIC